MQERVYQKRGEQYLLIKSPPASGKSRGRSCSSRLTSWPTKSVKQAIIVVPEKSIGASFARRAAQPVSASGPTGRSRPRWNLCDAPGSDNGRALQGGPSPSFLASGDQALVCTHATFRFALDRFGVEAFDVAVSSPWTSSTTSRLTRTTSWATTARQLMDRGKTHIVAMTGSYFRGDAEACAAPGR